MSIPQGAAFHPDEWVEDKIVQAKQQTRILRTEVEESIIKHPLGAVALGFGAGYLARSLPLARVASTAVRIALSFAPHVLLGIGAARAWQCLRNDGSGIGTLPTLEKTPEVAPFPGP